MVQAFKILFPIYGTYVAGWRSPAGKQIHFRWFVTRGTTSFFLTVSCSAETSSFFKFPYQDHPHFVKRVIGLPGITVKIVDQQVYVNGNPLDEPYAVHDPASGYGDSA